MKKHLAAERGKSSSVARLNEGKLNRIWKILGSYTRLTWIKKVLQGSFQIKAAYRKLFPTFTEDTHL